MSELLGRTEPVELRVAQVVGVEERVIRVIVVPYNRETIVEHPYKPGEAVRERVEPGAFDGIETRKSHVTANRDHDPRRVIGLAVDYDFEDERGLVAEIEVAETPLGDETLALARRKILKASIGMLVRRSDGPIINGLRSVRRAFLDHIALLPNPAYTGADVLAVRQAQQLEQGQPVPTPNLDLLLADPVITKVLEGR